MYAFHTIIVVRSFSVGQHTRQLARFNINQVNPIGGVKESAVRTGNLELYQADNAFSDSRRLSSDSMESIGVGTAILVEIEPHGSRSFLGGHSHVNSRESCRTTSIGEINDKSDNVHTVFMQELWGSVSTGNGKADKLIHWQVDRESVFGLLNDLFNHGTLFRRRSTGACLVIRGSTAYEIVGKREAIFVPGGLRITRRIVYAGNHDTLFIVFLDNFKETFRFFLGEEVFLYPDARIFGQQLEAIVKRNNPWFIVVIVVERISDSVLRINAISVRNILIVQSRVPDFAVGNQAEIGIRDRLVMAPSGVAQAIV